MDAMSILMPILIIALIALVIALVLFVLKLMKTLQAANDTITKLEPTLKNVETITTDLQPTVKKVEPLVDRVQLTLDAVNLEMMRVDEILEDVTVITDGAAGATTAVETVATVPAKAVTGVAAKIRERFGTKDASNESAKIADQRVAVEEALEEYLAAEEHEATAADDHKPGYVEVEEPAAEATAEEQTAEAEETPKADASPEAPDGE